MKVSNLWFRGLLLLCSLVAIEPAMAFQATGNVSVSVPVLTQGQETSPDSDMPEGSDVQEGMEKFYPQQLTSQDGSAFTYAANCCEKELHFSVIVSDRILPVGCPSNGEPSWPGEAIGFPEVLDPGTMQPIPLTTFFALTAEKVNQVEFYYHLTADFKKPYEKAVFGDCIVVSASDYFGSKIVGDNSIQIKDVNGKERYFTLVLTDANTFFVGSAAGKSGVVPLLIRSRPQSSYQYQSKFSNPPNLEGTIKPSKKVKVAEKLAMVDFSVPTFTMVTIRLPGKNADDPEANVQCFLVHRLTPEMDKVEMRDTGLAD